MTLREKLKIIFNKLHDKEVLKWVLIGEISLFSFMLIFRVIQSKIAHAITFLILATMYYFVNKHMKEKYPTLTQNNTTKAEK